MCRKHSLNIIISLLTEVAFRGFCVGGLHIYILYVYTVPVKSLKTVLLLFLILFSGFFDEQKVKKQNKKTATKKQHLFKIEIFCNNMHYCSKVQGSVIFYFFI